MVRRMGYIDKDNIPKTFRGCQNGIPGFVMEKMVYLMRSMFVGVDCVKMTCNVRIWGDFGTVNVPPKSFRESPFIFQVVRYVLVI